MTAYAALHAEISAYLTNHLTEGTDINRYVTAILEEADLSQSEISFEVRGHHTKRGNPLPCTFDVPEALRAAYVTEQPLPHAEAHTGDRHEINQTGTTTHIHTQRRRKTMSTHHAVWFSNPATGQRTAALILRSDKHDLKDIAKVSHLFPYSESLKMVKYHVSPGFPDFTGAFNWVQDNLNV